jgi:superfamily I DNA/RNA helicase
VKWLKKTNKAKRGVPASQQVNAVNFVTMHSSKELEFRVVGAELSDVEKVPEEKARLAYMAMNRAAEVLLRL